MKAFVLGAAVLSASAAAAATITVHNVIGTASFNAGAFSGLIAKSIKCYAQDKTTRPSHRPMPRGKRQDDIPYRVRDIVPRATPAPPPYHHPRAPGNGYAAELVDRHALPAAVPFDEGSNGFEAPELVERQDDPTGNKHPPNLPRASPVPRHDPGNPGDGDASGLDERNALPGPNPPFEIGEPEMAFDSIKRNDDDDDYDEDGDIQDAPNLVQRQDDPSADKKPPHVARATPAPPFDPENPGNGGHHPPEKRQRRPPEYVGAAVSGMQGWMGVWAAGAAAVAGAAIML